MYTREQRQAAGSKGGRKTALKYGPAWMSLIGARGFEATKDKVFSGDHRATINWLMKAQGMPPLESDACTPLMMARMQLLERLES